jgi:hypothetical protein
MLAANGANEHDSAIQDLIRVFALIRGYIFLRSPN